MLPLFTGEPGACSWRLVSDDDLAVDGTGTLWAGCRRVTPDDNGEVLIPNRVRRQPREPPRALSGQPWDAAGPCPPLLNLWCLW